MSFTVSLLLCEYFTSGGARDLFLVSWGSEDFTNEQRIIKIDRDLESIESPRARRYLADRGSETSGFLGCS